MDLFKTNIYWLILSPLILYLRIPVWQQILNLPKSIKKVQICRI